MSAPTRTELLDDLTVLSEAMRDRGELGLVWRLGTIRSALMASDDLAAWREAEATRGEYVHLNFAVVDLAPMYRDILMALPGAIDAMHEAEKEAGA